MRTPLKRSVILGSALIAALTLGGPTLAGAADGQTDRAAASTTTTTEDGIIVTKENGFVIEGHGKNGSRTAYVSVYENNLFGNHLQVSINDKHFGSKVTEKAFVTDGVLVAKVMVNGYKAVIKGTVAENGEPSELREVMNDNNYKIITKGTNQPLLVDAKLTYRGKTYRLAADTAFAYDLTVKKVPLANAG